MTNPNNSVGTNAGYNGRTTPNAFNDVLGVFDVPGIVSGWECTPKSGMTVQIGGGDVRDVAVAEDANGNRVTINNRSGAPIELTLPGAPATGNRYDVIVAYVNNPINGAGASDVDFPSQVGLIVVSGTVAANPNYPSPTQINDAITADGGDGPNAYQVQLCSIFVGQGVTTIGPDAIEGATESTISLVSLDDGAVTPEMIDTSAYGRFARDNDGGSQTFTANDRIVALYPNQLIQEVGCSYSAGAFTISQAGYWIITGGGRVALGASCGTARLLLNGSPISVESMTGYATSSVSTTSNASMSWAGHLSAGDTITMDIQTAVNLTNNTAKQQHMEGFCVHVDN